MKVWGWDQVLLSFLDPLFSLSILALWAMSVSEGVVAYAIMPAIITFIHLTSQGSSTALKKCIESSFNIDVWVMFFSYWYLNHSITCASSKAGFTLYRRACQAG